MADETPKKTRRYIITLDVTVDAEEFFGQPPTEWDWDEMLEFGDGLNSVKFEEIKGSTSAKSTS